MRDGLVPCGNPAALLLDIGTLVNLWACEGHFNELIGDRARIVRDLRREGD